MGNIYETKLARKDILYADWICKTNYVMQMNTGASIHGNAKMTPARMRRWYLDRKSVV